MLSVTGEGRKGRALGGGVKVPAQWLFCQVERRGTTASEHERKASSL